MVAITSSSSSSTNGSHDATPPIYVCHDSKAEIYSQKKISRKQWSVQGEPRTLLKRLRSQLAEDGCAESQLSMAKTLLEHSEDLNYEENCHQAVFWLTQASFQGSLEATELLRKCFDEGIGICEQNYQDVKRCLEMDQQEKLAVVATKNLFTSLSEGNDFVTERRVLAKFYEICKIDCHENLNSKISSGDKCEIKSYLEDKFGSRRLSESSIISAGLEFIKGEIPSAVRIQSSVLPFNEAEENLFWKRYVSLLQEFILSSIESNLAQKFSIFSKTPVAFSFSFILTLSLFVIYSCSFSKFYIASTYCLWLVCFFVMSYSSITIMVLRKNQRIFCVWGQVFQEFNSELDVDVAIRRYKYKCIHYYAAYFSGMLVFLILFPIVDAGIKAFTFPPFCIISLCLLVSSFKSNFFFYMLCSIFYFFAHYINGQIYVKQWIAQCIPCISEFIIDESVHLGNVLYLSFDIGSVFHGLWFVSLTFVSFTIGPFAILYHTMSIFWFHLTLLTFFEIFGLWVYISLLSWIIFSLLPQGFNFLSIFIPAFFTSFACYSSGLGIVLTLTVFLLLFSFLLTLCAFNPNLGTVMKYIFLVLSLLFLWQQPANKMPKVSSLKWEQFQNFCLPSKESIEAHTVYDCSRLKGLLVEWQASVKQIEVESIVNIPEIILSFLPPPLSSHLRCTLSPLVSDCEEVGNEKEKHLCSILKDFDECSLSQWNDYNFKITVVMESNFWKFTKNSEIVLMAGNEFATSIRNLSVHDKISFRGVLSEGIGTWLPRITLNSFKCLECKNSSSLSVPIKINIDYEKLSQAFKFTFNFIFGPTLTI